MTSMNIGGGEGPRNPSPALPPYDPEIDDGDEFAPEAGYTTGYGCPPVHSRFPPGRSGNPNGRPRRSPDIQRIVEARLKSSVKVKTSSGTQRVSAAEAVVITALNQALKGNTGMIRFLLEMQLRICAEHEAREAAAERARYGRASDIDLF